MRNAFEKSIYHNVVLVNFTFIITMIKPAVGYRYLVAQISFFEMRYFKELVSILTNVLINEKNVIITAKS